MIHNILPTFEIENCRDMLDKLLWELEQLEQAETGRAAAYTCVNAAVTAWHLREWVWRDICRDAALRLTLAIQAGVGRRKIKRDQWYRFLASEHTPCPSLRYCRVIATASKHGHFKMVRGESRIIETYRSPALSMRWKLKFDSEVIHAAALFEDVFRFWENFIWEHKIADSGRGETDEVASMSR